MRAIFLLGGFVGFLLSAATSFYCGRSGNRVLLDGAVGCLAGGMLFRWFWSKLTLALADAVRTKRAAQRAMEEAAAAAKATPVIPTKAR
ncbi:MAG TPA: hypothetical protein VFT72_18435 [Opitutaceae bacterium]|nr:hypothetical protein [Opitutaceae bacterium]